PVENKRFYFTKFFFENRKKEDLVTGPKRLKYTFEESTSKTIKEREKNEKFKHKSINDLITALKNNFSCIPETAGIYNLETVNDVHSNTVSDHTLDVVNNLYNNENFNKLDNR